MTLPGDTHLWPTKFELAWEFAQNFETSLYSFLVQMTLRDKEMETKVLWFLYAHGTY